MSKHLFVLIAVVILCTIAVVIIDISVDSDPSSLSDADQHALQHTMNSREVEERTSSKRGSRRYRDELRKLHTLMRWIDEELKPFSVDDHAYSYFLGRDVRLASTRDSASSSKLVVAKDTDSKWYTATLARMGGWAMHRHRAQWEQVAVFRAVENRIKLSGSLGLGYVADGDQHLLSAFSRAGAKVVSKRLHDDDEKVDFIWSSTISSLESVEAAERFVLDTAALLNPGGIAVHQAQILISSLTYKLPRSRHGLVLRAIDVERIAAALEHAGGGSATMTKRDYLAGVSLRGEEDSWCDASNHEQEHWKVHSSTIERADDVSAFGSLASRSSSSSSDASGVQEDPLLSAYDGLVPGAAFKKLDSCFTSIVMVIHKKQETH